MYKVGLYTLGCKVSSYETEAVAEEFCRRGFLVCDFSEVCDVYVINTCTVTAESDAKSRKYIRRAIRKNPEGLVLVMGCYSQRAPEEVCAIEGVAAVVGTADKLSLVPIAERLLKEKEAERRDTGAAFSVETFDKCDEMQPPSEEKISDGDGSCAHIAAGRSSSGGCKSQAEDNSYDGDTVAAPTAEKLPIVNVGSLDGVSFEKMCIEHAPRTRGYVKIEDGCECKCTYCAIAAARGPVRSKLPEEVITEVKGLYSRGTREVVLTGIETGSYGADFDEEYTLSDLLCELDRIEACDRIRLGSMAPELIGEKFIMKVKDLKILVPHFHVSMQSGSSSVLKSMKRRYTRERALENLTRIREYIPDVTFTADLMVGFPGESEEDFLETVSFVREAGLLDAHVFAYSKREGTPAAERADQVPEDVKHDRSARLIAVKNEVRDSVLSGIVKRGKPLSVVFETKQGRLYTGHSDSYVEVVCEAPRDVRTEICEVVPKGFSDGKIVGSLKE